MIVFLQNQICDDHNLYILSLQTPPLHYRQRHLIILNWRGCQNLNQYNLSNRKGIHDTQFLLNSA